MVEYRVAERRDNIDLVWSISELSGLFERRTNIDDFLQAVVDRIAEHLESDVCSVYLLDEAEGRLVLRATRGLDPGSVGTVSLMLGEGITGTAVKELRPIREARGNRNPLYKFIPGTNEERYQSFLAVPIRRGLSRIGAIVVQHQKQDQFTAHDTRALQAIAGQLASTLENVEMIMELHNRRAPLLPARRGAAEQIPCQCAAEGIAVGRVVHLGGVDDVVEPDHDDEDQEAAFRRALERTDRQLEALHRELDERLADIASLIFGTHLLMLRDEEFSGLMVDGIRNGSRAHVAVRTIVDRYVEMLSASTNPRTREKTQDVRDLGSRLLRNLRSEQDDGGDLRGRVVLAHELFPSDLVRIAAEHAEGIILTGGGATAHITILARSLEIPTVFLRAHDDGNLSDGDMVAVDAYEGVIHRDPSPALLERFERARELHRIDETVRGEGPAFTRDGVAVELLANVNILHDVEVASRVGAAGIGLYRSEFPFLVRNDFPSEIEQLGIYRRIAERAPEGPLVFRTLDIGGDKLFSESEHSEANPFLGLRGIRFSLAHRDLFDEQLRAMLRAGVGRDLRIMFPMIASVEEFIVARSRVLAMQKDLEAERIDHHRSPLLGVMIELPSAVELASDFARVTDFMSIGSNDLVMYLLAVDRANERVEALYQPVHPAVLRSFKRVVNAGREHDCPVSICGEAGGDPQVLRFLIGVGLRSISADPARIPGIRTTIAQIDSRDAARLAPELLAMSTTDDVLQRLRRT